MFILSICDIGAILLSQTAVDVRMFVYFITTATVLNQTLKYHVLRHTNTALYIYIFYDISDSSRVQSKTNNGNNNKHTTSIKGIKQ